MNSLDIKAQIERSQMNFLTHNFKTLIVAALFSMLSIGCAGLKDIRPDDYQRAPTPAEVAEGKRILDEMAETLGSASFKSSGVYRAQVSDDWSIATLPFSLFRPWKTQNQKFEIVQPVGTKDFRIVFLNGPDKGNGWGAVGDDNFRSEQENVSASDDKVRFAAAAVGYLLQMPHTINDATFVQSLGQAVHEGKTYNKVLASWKSGAPQDDLDQYILWVDAETQRPRFVEFTIRGGGKSFSTTVSYGDWIEVDGVWFAKDIPFLESVGGNPILHSVALHQIETNVSVDADYLNPLGGTSKKLPASRPSE